MLRSLVNKATGEELLSAPTASHTGELPPKASLPGFEAGHSVLTSAQIAKDGALTVRLCEAEGQPDKDKIRPPFEPIRAVLTDLNETMLAEAMVGEGKVAFTVAPHRVAQVKIYR